MLSSFKKVLLISSLTLYATLPIDAAPQEPTITPAAAPIGKAIGIHAIVPTRAGQIGINPVDHDFGNANTYSGHVIGVDTKYITVIFATDNTDSSKIVSSTKWIGVDPVMIDPPANVAVAVSTATANADGLSVGDVSLVLPEGLALALHGSASEAISACDALPKRDLEAGAALVCLLNAAKKAVKDGIVEKYVQSQVVEKWGLKIAQGATAIEEGLAALTEGEKAQALIWLGVVAVLYAQISDGEASPPAIAKVNIPANGLGVTPPKEKCPDGFEKKHKDSPLCFPDDCAGLAEEKCTTGDFKDCPCLLVVPEPRTQYGSLKFLMEQQKWLDDIMAALDKPSEPFCLYGAAPRQPREPKSYCMCGENPATYWSVTKGPTPCPWSPESTGASITWTTPAPPEMSPNPPETTVTPPEVTTPPAPAPTEAPPCIQGWCGAPFCSPECKPPP